jgi:MerR family transcriptional regulator, copper efflux regulator
MLISELAEQAGLTTKAIRHYDRIGVLDPPNRTPGGYRDYDPDALARLAFIRAGRSAGLTLGELRQVIALRDRGETPCAHVSDLITSKRAEVDSRIAALEHLRSELAALEQRARRLDPADCDASKVCHIITTQR